MFINIQEDVLEKAKQAFYGDLAKNKISKELKIDYYTLEKIWEYYFSPEQRKERSTKMYANSKTGDKNPRFGKPTMRPVENVDDGNGYTIKWKPEWWTGRKGSKYVFEHQLVICEALGLTEMPKDFVVHHINGDRKDNSISNLALLTKSAHTSLHQRENRIKKGLEK